MKTEKYKVWGRKGSVSMIEGPELGIYEVWAVDGSLGDPQVFFTWELACEAYLYALAGVRMGPT